MSVQTTIHTLFTPKKGIVALDESASTVQKRFDRINIENTLENRQMYRSLFMNTSDLGQYASGVILYEETLFQNDIHGVPFVETLHKMGVAVGIKVDMGTVLFPKNDVEYRTRGLDDLETRLERYKHQGAVFTKWRSVISIGDNLPSQYILDRNMDDMALYASITQQAGLIPIVEPEVLMQGNHTHRQCKETTIRVYQTLFQKLAEYNVVLDHVILKTGMIVSGDTCQEQASDETVGIETADILNQYVPHTIGGVVFLSGGQGPDESVRRLNIIAQNHTAPFPITFSFGRALQEPALDVWGGKHENLQTAMDIFSQTLQKNAQAQAGVWSAH